MRNIVVSQISRNTTVPRIVMTDGSRDFPVPRRQELATSYVAVKPSKGISVVSQQIYLFNDTIRNNICIYKKVSDEVIETACKDSFLLCIGLHLLSFPHCNFCDLITLYTLCICPYPVYGRCLISATTPVL